MARGQKVSDELKEKAIAMLATNNNVSAISRELDIPDSTLRTWQKNIKEGKDGSCKEFAKLREEKKKEFIENAWSSIELATSLINKRLARACFKEDLLDAMLEEALKETAGSDRRKQLVNNISNMKLDDITKISITLGTLYDKQALANGEATSREEQVVKKFEDFN